MKRSSLAWVAQEAPLFTILRRMGVEYGQFNLLLYNSYLFKNSPPIHRSFLFISYCRSLASKHSLKSPTIKALPMVNPASFVSFTKNTHPTLLCCTERIIFGNMSLVKLTSHQFYSLTNRFSPPQGASTHPTPPPPPLGYQKQLILVTMVHWQAPTATPSLTKISPLLKSITNFLRSSPFRARLKR